LLNLRNRLTRWFTEINAGIARLNNTNAAGKGTILINPTGTAVLGAAVTNPITLAGGTLCSSASLNPLVGDVTAAASTTSTILYADPANLAATDPFEMAITGTLHGSGNIVLLSVTNDPSPDSGNGFRLRGTSPSDFSGTITLSSELAGNCVEIRVADTGEGMSPEVLTRAFDPFFTTKPLGQGTGLGLSQVFGFVKQSGGNVKMYSQPGDGTTVKIYLPRMSEDADAQDGERDVASAYGGKQSGSILIVEDNDGVRAFSGDALRDYGFTVVEAADATQALRILDAGATIDLLFTDIGLPGLDGRELVTIVQHKCPRMRMLFTSGYAQMPTASSSRWDSDIPLLSKPYTRGQLYEKVMQVFDAP